jgi:hypothetical protein
MMMSMAPVTMFRSFSLQLYPLSSWSTVVASENSDQSADIIRSRFDITPQCKVLDLHYPEWWVARSRAVCLSRDALAKDVYSFVSSFSSSSAAVVAEPPLFAPRIDWRGKLARKCPVVLSISISSSSVLFSGARRKCEIRRSTW